MIKSITLFNDSYSAWKDWYLSDFEIRKTGLSLINQALQQTDLQFAEICQFHIDQATLLHSCPQVLCGPTGETNTLYTLGRGVTLCIQANQSASARLSLIAQSTAILITGNSLIICTDDKVILDALQPTLARIRFLPNKLIQFTTLADHISLLKHDICQVSHIGSPREVQVINQVIGHKDGPLCQFITETDLKGIPTAMDPNLSLRFINERTTTNNITSIGGNASLLQLDKQTFS